MLIPRPKSIAWAGFYVARGQSLEIPNLGRDDRTVSRGQRPEIACLGRDRRTISHGIVKKYVAALSKNKSRHSQKIKCLGTLG